MTLTGCIVIAGLLLILIATLIYSWKVAGAVQSKLLKAANSVGAIFWFMGAWDFVEMMVRSVYPSGLGFIAMALGFLTCGTALLVGLLIKKKDESDRC